MARPAGQVFKAPYEITEKKERNHLEVQRSAFSYTYALNSPDTSMSGDTGTAIPGAVSHGVISYNTQGKEDISKSPEMIPAERAGGSAPSSPFLQRKDSAGSTVESKIPRPSSLFASPSPLRRSGSLRLRGEKLGFTHAKHPVGRGGSSISPVTQRAPTSGNHFPSITETDEVWRNPRRGAGDSSVTKNLSQRQYHRSLQSLSSPLGRPSSVDSYPHTPTPSPEDREHLRTNNLNRFLLDHAKDVGSEQDDLDSLRSFGSNYSTQSACDHAHFARNGTTFSGRRMKYVVHCSSQAADPEEYLTPTQRANRQIRRLKALLEQSKKDLETKDENIFRLTKEVVELRLLRDEADGVGTTNVNGTFTASLSSPLRSVCNGELSPAEKVVIHTDSEMGTPASLSDSGHFDDLLSTASAQSSNSPGRQNVAIAESERIAESYQKRIDDMVRKQSEKSQEDRKSLIDMYEKKMEDMAKRHSEKAQDERKTLSEMYEKKMEEMAQKHHNKNQEDKKLLVEMYEKQIEDLHHTYTEEKATIVAKYDQIIKEVEKRHGETLQALKEEQATRITELMDELGEVSQKHSDLQHELFQARERCIQLEEDVEILKKSLAIQEQQHQEEVVQSAQLQAEVQLLRQSMEEQKQREEGLQQSLERMKQTDLSEPLRLTQVKEMESQEPEEADEKSAKLELEVESLRVAIADKNEQLQQANEWTTQLKEEIGKLQCVWKSSAKLEEEMEALKQYKENNDLLQKEVDSLRPLAVDLQKVQKELENEKFSSAQLQSTISALRTENQGLADERTELLKAKKELEAEVKSMAEVKEESNRIKRDMENLNQMINSERVEHAMLLQESQEKVQILETDIALLRDNVLQNEYKGRQLRELQMENTMLKDSLNGRSRDHEELVRANERLHHLHHTNAQLNELIEAYKNRELQLKMTYEEELDDLRELNDKQEKDLERTAQLEIELQNTYERLSAELDKQKELHEQKARDFEAEIQSLKLCIEEKEKMYNDLLLTEQNCTEKQRESAEVLEELKNAKEQISSLQEEVASLKKTIAEQEEGHNEMNLKMYLKGQEAAKLVHKDEVLEMAAQAPEKVSVPELLTQLAETEKELDAVKAMYRRLAESQANNSSSPEATLLFLKSAFYYFLTDEANCQGHLHAIQSILGFTDAEKQTIESLTYFRR